jgi:hypothetical protein
MQSYAKKRLVRMLQNGLKLNVNELRDQFAESCIKLEVLVNSEIVGYRPLHEMKNKEFCLHKPIFLKIQQQVLTLGTENFIKN